MYGAYLRTGDPVGMVADRSRLIIRVVAAQSDLWLIDEADTAVEMRIQGRPDLHGGRAIAGRILAVLPAGTSQLPSAALGYGAGGQVPIQTADREGRQASERIFEIRIDPDPAAMPLLLPELRVVVQFQGRSKPLALQWWRAIQQMVQKRFHI
jgi:putative peptide zinc metalloprotease protein